MKNLYVTDKEAAKIICHGVSTLRNWRFQGRGPRYVKLDGGGIRYRVDDLHNFMEKHLVKPGGEE